MAPSLGIHLNTIHAIYKPDHDIVGVSILLASLFLIYQSTSLNPYHLALSSLNMPPFKMVIWGEICLCMFLKGRDIPTLPFFASSTLSRTWRVVNNFYWIHKTRKSNIYWGIANWCFSKYGPWTKSISGSIWELVRNMNSRDPSKPSKSKPLGKTFCFHKPSCESGH